MSNGDRNSKVPQGAFGASGTAEKVGRLIPKRVPRDATARQALEGADPRTIFEGSSLVPPSRTTRFRNWRTAKLTAIRAIPTAIRNRIVAFRAKRAATPKMDPITKRWIAIGILFAIVLLGFFGRSMEKIVYPMHDTPHARLQAANASPGKPVISTAALPEALKGNDMEFTLPMPSGIDLDKHKKWLKTTWTKKCAKGELGRKMVKGSLIVCGDALEFNNTDGNDTKKRGG